MKNNLLILIFYIFFLSDVIYSFSDQEKVITSEKREARCYYLARLAMPVYILPAIKLKKAVLKRIIAHSIKNVSFSSTIMHECIQKIYLNSSFSPLLDLWDRFNEGHFLENQLLKREFCILILLLYKNIAIHLCTKEKKFILEHISAYYENINNKELHELLDILNIIALELKPLLASMTTSKISTWPAWIAKYWIPLMVTCATIIIKIMMYKKNKNKELTKIETLPLYHHGTTD